MLIVEALAPFLCRVHIVFTCSLCAVRNRTTYIRVDATGTLLTNDCIELWTQIRGNVQNTILF